ncbi:unnamed protein product [Rotaria magnacalcarata]|uniref:F-box domain-containing protein n=1 Tax=Rotaria magnacalcarata TaxID=392030 RepID=A0A816VST3_9BILA|nr:unnamed protein product [Rotaria magnacalcarata]CAF1393631.1 unnamed protein product [Rotaria magnacalcarata]CAF2060543.1 unnamed protein product [Rotaria magnacalcarata]CAF2092869.1 unnamed protein product [Rotaria magnacalcarata]CAF2124197.1 unnamed protein product [Rotaria magnacalcarata]
MSSDWTSLPDIVWYSVCEYLPKLTDIIHLSCTNRNLHQVLEQDFFWRYLIRIRYGPILLKRYCDEIFSNTNNCDHLYSSDKHFVEFEKQYSQLPPAILRNGWNLIVTDAQNGNMKGFAAAKRSKFYLPKLSSQLKMAITENRFRELVFQGNKTILSKLIYYYLSQRKIRLSFAYETYVCFDITRVSDANRPTIIDDLTSSFGSIAILDSRWLAAIRGEFHSIIPGRYAIICRIKLELLRYEQPSDEDQFTGEFTCIPEYGIMSSLEWDHDWFDLRYVINNSKRQSNQTTSQWFEEQMGIITIYELSKVYFGLRIWQLPYRKYTIMCDYIELKIIE